MYTACAGSARGERDGTWWDAADARVRSSLGGRTLGRGRTIRWWMSSKTREVPTVVRDQVLIPDPLTPHELIRFGLDQERHAVIVLSEPKSFFSDI